MIWVCLAIIISLGKWRCLPEDLGVTLVLDKPTYHDLLFQVGLRPHQEFPARLQQVMRFTSPQTSRCKNYVWFTWYPFFNNPNHIAMSHISDPPIINHYNGQSPVFFPLNHPIYSIGGELIFHGNMMSTICRWFSQWRPPAFSLTSRFCSMACRLWSLEIIHRYIFLGYHKENKDRC